MPRNTGGRRLFEGNEAGEKQKPRSAAERKIEFDPEADVKKKKKRDIEKAYTNEQMIAKLKRLADSLAEGKNFRIQIAGERITVPKNAIVNIEHEREDGEEEIEFQIKWKTE